MFSNFLKWQSRIWIFLKCMFWSVFMLLDCYTDCFYCAKNYTAYTSYNIWSWLQFGLFASVFCALKAYLCSNFTTPQWFSYSTKNMMLLNSLCYDTAFSVVLTLLTFGVWMFKEIVLVSLECFNKIKQRIIESPQVEVLAEWRITRNAYYAPWLSCCKIFLEYVCLFFKQCQI